MVDTRSKKRESIDTAADMNHTSSKKRKSLDTQIDVISHLPIDVLYRIVERLPLQDAARMSILSHKWLGIWTSTPFLGFDAQFFSAISRKVSKPDQFGNIVSKILFQHEGPIFKFALFVPWMEPFPDVTQWISYLSRSGLRDFSFHNVRVPHHGLSWRLFACVELETLKLCGCILNPPLNFKGFPKLTSLELDGVDLVCSRFNDLIRSCPVLQKVVLKDFTYTEHGHLVIDAPTLRNLVISGSFNSLDVKNGENLESASIDMLKLAVIIRRATGISDLIKVLANSSKLERLCLGGHCCKVLFKRFCNTFHNLKILELLSLFLDDMDDFSSVIRCIQSFPNIQTLKISFYRSKDLDEHLLDYNLDCSLHNLKCAEVEIWSASSTELKVIEFLLACSPVLEKLSVSLKTTVNHNSHSKMLMQLNRFRRVSRKVEVICPELIISSSSSQNSSSASSASSEDTYDSDASSSESSDSE